MLVTETMELVFWVTAAEVLAVKVEVRETCNQNVQGSDNVLN